MLFFVTGLVLRWQRGQFVNGFMVLFTYSP